MLRGKRETRYTPIEKKAIQWMIDFVENVDPAWILLMSLMTSWMSFRLY